MANLLPQTAVALKCLGNIDGPRFLDGRTLDASVGLAVKTDEPFSGTRWQVLDGQGGRVILKCLGDIDGPRFLRARLDGQVDLVPITEPEVRETEGVRWFAIDDGPGRVILKTAGQTPGTPFLDGRTANGTIGLAPATDGVFTGTHWLVAPLYKFGVDTFHVENCRSKGDHNDSDTLIVVVTTNTTAFDTQQVLLGDNLHAGDTVSQQFVGPFPVEPDALVTVTFTVLNGVGGSDALSVGLKIAGAALEVVAGLEGVNFLGLDAGEVEEAILSGVGGVLAGIGELLGIKESDPDCRGPVAAHPFVFLPGQLTGSNTQTFGPILETQRSPSQCGNDPHATVTYAARPL